MKSFVTSGTGNQQTLSEIESDKIPIYDSLTDAEADLSNLEEGQIGATKDEGSELSAPVDTVQSGNMHAVTSNAVAESCPRYINYTKGNIWTTEATSFTTTCDCYLLYSIVATTAGNRTIYIDNNKVGTDDNSGSVYVSSFYGYVKKGSVIRRGDNAPMVGGSYLRLFELI